MGGDCAGGCAVPVYVSACCALAWAVVGRAVLEEKLAVFCCRGKDFADERSYLVDLLVSGGKGAC